MKVHVRFLAIQRSPALAEYATRRIHQHLRRFRWHVEAVVLRISDLNGPRGGRDKRLQLTVTGPRLGSLSLAHTHSDPYAGIDLGLDRLSQAVGRSLARAAARRAPALAGRSAS